MPATPVPALCADPYAALLPAPLRAFLVAEAGTARRALIAALDHPRTAGLLAALAALPPLSPGMSVVPAVDLR